MHLSEEKLILRQLTYIGLRDMDSVEKKISKERENKAFSRHDSR